MYENLKYEVKENIGYITIDTGVLQFERSKIIAGIEKCLFFLSKFQSFSCVFLRLVV